MVGDGLIAHGKYTWIFEKIGSIRRIRYPWPWLGLPLSWKLAITLHILSVEALDNTPLSIVCWKSWECAARWEGYFINATQHSILNTQHSTLNTQFLSKVFHNKELRFDCWEPSQTQLNSQQSNLRLGNPTKPFESADFRRGQCHSTRTVAPIIYRFEKNHPSFRMK